MSLRDETSLLSFIEPDETPVRILTIESGQYLAALRERFPEASLFSVAASPGGEADVSSFAEMDYRETPLPFERNFFDIIVAEDMLSNVPNPQDICAGIGTFLKDTGYLLTSFENIRYWRVIQGLMNGSFYAIVRRLYSREGFERLLYASFYKDAFFMPSRGRENAGLVEKLVRAGFENRLDDLVTERWLVKATRSSTPIVYLKSRHTPDERRLLSKLLRRVEYDIDAPENVARLWRLIDDAGFSPEYLASFVRGAVLYRDDFYERLASETDDDRREVLMAWLTAAAEPARD